MEKAQWQEWQKALDGRMKHWEQQELRKEGDRYLCARCNQGLVRRTVYASLHNAFSVSGGMHAGGGKITTFDIPECPNGECQNSHPSFWDAELRLDGDTLRGPCIDS